MIEGLIRSPDDHPLNERERAMVDYALKLTRRPSQMVQDDLTPLRNAGLVDREILDLAMIVSYFAYVNRLADGLGVELEPGGPPQATK